MGIFGEVRREFIARPDGAKGSIFYKWPDRNIRKFSQLTVEQDEFAVFFRDGKPAGSFGPGRYTLDSSEFPVLGALLDFATGGNFFLSELYFISTREFTALRYGGRIDDVVDHETQFALGLRVFGEYSLRVSKADELLQLIGSQSMTNNDDLTDWVREFVLREMRTLIVGHINNDRWPLLGMAARTDEIETEILPRINAKLASYGFAVVRLGNLTISITDEDQATLKNFRRDVGYTKLAGGFTQYGAGRAMIGIGEGAALGGAAAGNAILGAGIGIGGLFAAGAASKENAGPDSGPAVNAGAQLGKAAAFCADCGTGAAPGAKFCTNCGHGLA